MSKSILGADSRAIAIKDSSQVALGRALSDITLWLWLSAELMLSS